jgi:beta-mannosidase
MDGLMNRIYLLLAVAVLSATNVRCQEPPLLKTLSLDGTWRYQPLAKTTLKSDGAITDDTTNLPPVGSTPVPSNWHLNGLPNFNGRVRFERDFNLSQRLAPDDRAFLVFHGVDYFATVELNGALIGKHEGYFQTFEFDVTHQLRAGRNHLAVIVDAPKEEPGAVWPDHKRMIKGILSHWDCKPGGPEDPAVGQDGTSAGIWNHVELEIRHTAWLGTVKIQSFLFDRKEIPGHQQDTGKDADILITADLAAVQPGAYTVTAQIAGQKATTRVQVASPQETAVLTIHLENPKLWWTWDLGEPNLYEATFTVSDEQGHALYARCTHFGVRTITLDEKTGHWGLNGVRFFIRGTNIVPDMWLAHYTPDRIQTDVDLLRKAHINGVRVCVHVNREELYEALDRAGIVAWQDFPLQWDYVQSSEFMQEAARQLRDMIRQFYNHPSIITWVCQNESTVYNVNVIDPFLAQAGIQEDSSRPVRPVSHFREHFYEGWYGGDYHNYIDPPGGPIISELGAQALPSLEEVHQMFGGAWPPDWKKLAYHDFQFEQTFKVAKLPIPDSWPAFVESSQRYQAELLKFAIEHYRRVKYQRIGSFFQFQFIDCWPSITWSVVSYDRRPKAGYDAMVQAYQPVLIEADVSKRVWSLGKPNADAPIGLSLSASIWIVNDTHAPIKAATYEAHLHRGDQDAIVGKSEKPIDIPADEVIKAETIYCTLPTNLAPGAYELVLTLTANGEPLSRNSYPITIVP